jgi:hypothetical protein
MTVRRDGDIIRLEGDCRVEQAETLAAMLQEPGVRAVDIGACSALHGAVLQTLLAFSPVVVGSPEDPFLKDLVAPNWLPAHKSGAEC